MKLDFTLPAKNIMLDLETLGLRANAVILSIGAVAFNEKGIVDTFYDTILIDSCLREGMTVEGGTIEWWINQNVAAKNFISNGSDLKYALLRFTDWAEKYGTQDELFVWGNGADFDNVKLTEAYAKTHTSPPWNWRNNRCYRTVMGCLPAKRPYKPIVPHYSLSDAAAQTLNLLETLGVDYERTHSAISALVRREGSSGSSV